MSSGKDEFRLIKLIQKLEIFSALDRREAQQVLRLCERRTYAVDEIVWNPGDPGDDMQVLLTGKLHVRDKAGKLIGEVLPGGSFGEMACLSGSPRFVGFQAVESSSALLLTRTCLRSLITANANLYIRILETTIKLLAERATRLRSGHATDDPEPGDLGTW